MGETGRVPQRLAQGADHAARESQVRRGANGGFYTASDCRVKCATLRAVKLFESRSVQVARLVFSAKKGSNPCKQRPSKGHRLPEDDASGND